MNSENLSDAEEILKIIRRDGVGKLGILCLNCLLVRARFLEIYAFMEGHNIPLPANQKLSKLELLDYISVFFYKQYQKSPTLHKQFKTPIGYIGNFILNDDVLSDYLTRFDFISKQELIDAFADYCADYWNFSVQYREYQRFFARLILN